MVKLVNVFPSGPITTTNPPIRSRVYNINMPVEDIRKCLIANAYIEEILSGKKTVKLTFENYDKDLDGTFIHVTDSEEKTDYMETKQQDIPEEKEPSADDNKVENKNVEDHKHEEKEPSADDNKVENKNVEDHKHEEATTDKKEDVETPKEEQVKDSKNIKPNNKNAKRASVKPEK